MTLRPAKCDEMLVLRCINLELLMTEMGHVWTAPAVQGKRIRPFAKRYGCSHVSGLSMQPFWLRALM